MLGDFNFLDSVWRGLLVGTVTSSVALLILSSVLFLIKDRLNHGQTKYFFNNQLLLALFLFTGSFLLVKFFDPELAAACFSRFAQTSSSLNLTRIVAALWLLGCGFLILKDLLQLGLAFNKVKSFKPIEDHATNSSFQRILNLSCPKSSVQVYSSLESKSPFVWGFFQYRLVLPQNLQQNLSRNSFENILAHEVIHIRDRDSLWLLADLIFRRMLFFNPLVYALSAQHRVSVEKAADEQALKLLKSTSSEMLQSLLDMVTLAGTHLNSNLSQALHASRSFYEVQQRMQALTNAKKSVASKASYRLTLGLSLLLAFGVSAAQAQLAMLGMNSGAVGAMCTQVQHEKIIESWMNIKPETNSSKIDASNKCEP
jgi:beta-lactamase regulating signal transducer with metallopeptidase domain